MADLDTILHTLRRYREDLDALLESTASRSSETARLIEKIEDLRVRSERTLRAFERQAGNTEPPKNA